MGLQDAMRVADDKYSDLVARKAADQHVIAEITNLTEQVTRRHGYFKAPSSRPPWLRSPYFSREQ